MGNTLIYNLVSHAHAMYLL